MKRTLLSLFILLCLILSSTLHINAAAMNVVLNDDYTIALGSNELTALNGDATTVNLYSFKPSEIGAYKVTVSEGAILSFWGGSRYYLLESTETSSSIEYDKENNTFNILVQKGFVGNSYLIGVAGAERFTLNVEFMGEEALPFDPATMAWEIYEPTVSISPYTFDAADDYYSMTYVDVTKPHTAVLGSDGYYHLDTADGEILFVNLTASAPYMPLSNAVAYGAVRDYIYDENGNFVTKLDFNDCVTQYYENSDPTMKVYPLTYDLMYILQVHGENHGWYDFENTYSGYIFDTMKVDEDTAWMYCVGYFRGYDPNAGKKYTVSFDGKEMEYVAGEAVRITTDKLVYDAEADTAQALCGWTVDGVAEADLGSNYVEFIMPANDVALTAQYVLHGDIDGDGCITAMDLFSMKLAVKTGQSGVAEDLDFDGKLTASDILVLLSVIKGTYNYSI